MRSLIELFIIAVVVIYLYENYKGKLPNIKLDTVPREISEERKKGDDIDFYIRPLGKVEYSDLTDVLKYVENFYGYKCKNISKISMVITVKSNQVLKSMII